MKLLSLIILLFALPPILKADEAHLTKLQVKQITALVAKGEAPGEPMFDASRGIWTCSAGPSGPSWGLIIEIRDKDGFYRQLGLGKDFKMATSFKRRISKILKSKEGEQGGRGDSDKPAN